jgi:hypothetical protein
LIFSKTGKEIASLTKDSEAWQLFQTGKQEDINHLRSYRV